jgi:mersacidin/lichenicidin family type 2 lantibiotic
MTRHEIIRAWRDPEYRNRLSQAERELLPAHPAGLIELSDDDLLGAAGGKPPSTPPLCSALACPSVVFCPTDVFHCTLQLNC